MNLRADRLVGLGVMEVGWAAYILFGVMIDAYKKYQI